MSELKLFNSTHQKTMNLKLSGKINEEATIEDYDYSQFEVLRVDLHEVSSINSVGVRTWLKWIAKIPKDKQLVFFNVPKILVDQCNMIRGFIPVWAKIESFEVPYYCPSCEAVTKKMIINQSTEYHLFVVKSIPCGQCQKDTELDVVAESFFRFLNAKK
jgi:ABC-type transporter Mla MlaB component